jgi:hypothetical protein
LPPGNNPDEVFIDSSTGLVKLRNHWDIKTQYEIDIFIKITDGTNNWFLSVPSVFINTVCGPYSTILTAPTLVVADKVPNSPPIDYSGTFTSSNENCPVLSHNLALGADDFDLTDNGDSFEIVMENDANSAETIYTFAITAHAEGGAEGSIELETTIERVCFQGLIGSFSKVYQFDIPESDDETVNFPAASTLYVSQPDFLEGCTQTFSYAMSDGSAAPAELSIDASTGIFSLVNKASIKGTYYVDITIVSSDEESSANDVTNTVTNVEIDLVCGVDSTIVTAPSMETLYQIPNYTPLSIFGSFVSSNPTCPVETLTVSDDCTGSCFGITLDWIDDDLSTLSGDFTVTMDSSANSVVSQYQYTVEAYAEGGYYAATTGIMDIQYACYAFSQPAYDQEYTFDLPWE